MTVYVSLDEFLYLAQQATGLDEITLVKAANLHLADSALNAPAASFGGVEAYQSMESKAAVLVWHLTKNHPLPDGNKRTAWLTLMLFLAKNDLFLTPHPRADEIEALMVGIASDEISQEQVEFLLRERL